jgi:tetratricopeptide (TPR) repeat protein
MMPLHTAWLLPLALLVMLAWLRRPGLHVAPLVLFALPLLVCLLFYYSPRYRFPVVPVVAVASAWALVQAFRWPRGRVWALLVPVGLALGVGTGFLNQALDIDAPGPRRVPLYVGLAWAAWQNGKLEEAVRWYEQVRAIDPEYPTIASNLGALLAELGKPAEARAYLEEALAEAPDDAETLSRLSEVLLTQGEIADAVARAIAAVRLRPDSPDLHNNLAYALVQAGQPEQARAHWQRALELDPAHVPARINLGQLLRLEGREDEALAAFEAVLALEPQNTTALLQVARILYRRGDVQAAIPKFWEAYGQTPDDPYLAAELAWVLATTPGLPPAYRDMALRLAHQVASGPGREVPEALDTYAAALAATGRFAEAREVARVAIAIAEAQPNAALAEVIARRLQVYESDQPYVARFGPPVPAPSSAPAATQPATTPGETQP